MGSKNIILIQLFIVVIGLTFGCSALKKEPNGVYHYVHADEKAKLAALSVRFDRNKKFTIFGVNRYVNLRDSTFGYYRFVSYGDWQKKDDYLILNSNFSKRYEPRSIFNSEDSEYLSQWPWDLSEVVMKVEQDSFVMYKPKSIFSIKRNILLSQ